MHSLFSHFLFFMFFSLLSIHCCYTAGSSVGSLSSAAPRRLAAAEQSPSGPAITSGAASSLREKLCRRSGQQAAAEDDPLPAPILREEKNCMSLFERFLNKALILVTGSTYPSADKD
jgi:hypothetical protein